MQWVRSHMNHDHGDSSLEDRDSLQEMTKPFYPSQDDFFIEKFEGKNSYSLT